MSKKILFIESGVTGGGSFQSLYELLKNIDRKKFTPFVICFNKTKYNKLWKKLNVDVILTNDLIYSKSNSNFIFMVIKKIYRKLLYYKFLPFNLVYAFFHFFSIQKISKIINKEKIDFIVLNDQILRDVPFIINKKNESLKIISFLRSTRGNIFNKKIIDYVNRQVDCFISNSDFSKNFWIRKGINKNKIQTLHNFISKNCYSDNKVKLIKNTTYRLGTLANFTEAKGHKFLINAFDKLIKIEPKYKLYLSGSGILLNEVLNDIKYKNLENIIHYLGYSENIDDFFSKIDILIVPSKNEAFGRVIIEAMQRSIPVIATNVDGITEIINHEYNGLLINYGSIENFISSVNLLSKNFSLRKRIINNGLDTVKIKFSTDLYMIKFYEILNEL